jgi:FixJ family two-component response regulator
LSPARPIQPSVESNSGHDELATAGDAYVWLLDHDGAARARHQQILESAGLNVLAFQSAAELLQATPPEATSCLVTELCIPTMSGVGWHEELTKAQIQVPVIFLTAYGSIAAAVRATKEGAVDFLTKPVNAQQLLDAVFAALAQDRMRREEERVRAAIRERFVLLTPREREVLFRVAAGRLNKQIAGELGVSEVMVKVHRRNGMRKLNVKTVADLVRISDYFYWSLSKDAAKEILPSVQ